MVFWTLERSAVIPLASLFVHPALSAYTSTNNSRLHDNSQSCSCYVVNSGANSNTPEYFQFYRFFDFRNLADRPGQYVKPPPIVKDSQDQGQEPVQNANVLTSDAWSTDWGIQSWDKPATEYFPRRMVNSPANVYISQNDDPNDWYTWLTLRTTRLEDFQSVGEVENMQKNLKHCSIRLYGKVMGAKGAIAGLFTYFDDKNESDIEIRTEDPKDKIRYTNQPALDKDGNEVVQASSAPDKLSPWDEWQEHRIDWLPENSYWYLNDKQVAANNYSVPREPSYLVVNMWSDGGEWSGNMSVGESGEFQIQWIELVFNTSGPVEGVDDPKSKRSVDLFDKRGEEKGCKVVCKVDGVKQLGTPEVVGAAAGLAISWGLLAIVGVVSTLIGI